MDNLIIKKSKTKLEELLQEHDNLHERLKEKDKLSREELKDISSKLHDIVDKYYELKKYYDNVIKNCNEVSKKKLEKKYDSLFENKEEKTISEDEGYKLLEGIGTTAKAKNENKDEYSQSSELDVEEIDINHDTAKQEVPQESSNSKVYSFSNDEMKTLDEWNNEYGNIILNPMGFSEEQLAPGAKMSKFDYELGVVMSETAKRTLK